MFIFNAKYLAVLDLFAGKNDTRYYLNGYNVVPHPKGGALLRASNGHIACLIHDPDGRCRGEHIIRPNPDLLRAAKRKLGKRWPGPGGEKWVTWGGRKSNRLKIMATAAGSPPKSVNEGIDQYVAPHSNGFDGALIDGPFPNVDRILPPEDELTPGLHGFYNPEYLAVLGKAASLLGILRSGVTAWSQGDDGKKAALVRFDGADNVLAVIMPMMPGSDHWDGSGVDTFRQAPL